MTSPLKLGVAGLGTVGAGVVSLLRANADLITARAGRPIEVVAVSARDRGRDRGVSLDGLAWHDDPVELATAPGLDAVVEVMGGSEGPARALVEASLAAGRPVVTANKALLATHGVALARLVEKTGATLAYEAAVAGGIPAIKALREGLAANRITRVAGILNGTCNYILTEMRVKGLPFATVLKTAQELGYAEADPGFDIDGVDAAHKLAILAALAFGRPVDLDALHIEGIRHVSALDIALAGELGYRIKLLGIASQEKGGVTARVHPCMVPEASPLAAVEGVFNAVLAEGDAVGRVVLQGRGAGAGPTASAVVADIIDLARGRTAPLWGAASETLDASPALPMAAHRGAYYLRLMVLDQPGVIADVTAVLRDARISLESMLQRGRAPGEAVPVVLVTHECEEAQMSQALTRLAGLPTVVEPPAMIRIEAL
ncbi:homoserine dehydrogenase [Roseococcus suduntuyensis]|uniref:Homoserine dehydrogenase n=1 Tax=Roseococcus suduntuyensis TaxID=455361 RepID=A0A840ACJ8_9PROT|nr:homoserine dehydrogenase [Roseococcus suduntuyensis]MBB3898642.1 homoserine dehydrogenase [Roseococcus suduntuyensis]